jgi:hypothetical protein
MKRHLGWVVLGLSFAALTGCYRKVSENGGLVFSFEPWVAGLVAVLGVAAVPVGIVLFVRGQRFWGVCLAILGPLAAVVVAPGMYLDRVVVNQDGFYSRHGFWWNPTVHQIRYGDLSQVQLVVEERSGRRGKTYSYYFDCSFKSGKQERVPLGDIMREALPEIAQQFREHGVPVHLPPNLLQ